MKVRVQKVSGMNFEAYASGRRVMISAAPELGGGGATGDDISVTDGDEAGARPMEMVLMGLGGCSGEAFMRAARPGEKLREMFAT